MRKWWIRTMHLGFLEQLLSQITRWCYLGLEYVSISEHHVPSFQIPSTSTDHCSLPNLSPLLPPPKSELANPKCSKSQFVNQPNPSQLDTTKQKSTENAQADTADKTTSTRLRPSSKKMRARAKCLRVLSGRTLATESGVGLNNFMIQIDNIFQLLHLFCSFLGSRLLIFSIFV